MIWRLHDARFVARSKKTVQKSQTRQKKLHNENLCEWMCERKKQIFSFSAKIKICITLHVCCMCWILPKDAFGFVELRSIWFGLISTASITRGRTRAIEKRTKLRERLRLLSSDTWNPLTNSEDEQNQNEKNVCIHFVCRNATLYTLVFCVDTYGVGEYKCDAMSLQREVCNLIPMTRRRVRQKIHPSNNGIIHIFQKCENLNWQAGTGSRSDAKQRKWSKFTLQKCCFCLNN